MKIHIIVASINELTNMTLYQPMLVKHDSKLIVVDEGDRRIRMKNDNLLSDIPHAFYGPAERRNYFKDRFGSKCKRYFEVIPKRCHAETSFGFLVAYEEQPDMVIELDDDTLPVKGQNIVDQHANNLFTKEGLTVYAKRKWYNTIENLELNANKIVYPRGYPYAPDVRDEREYKWVNENGKCVLNMGLWAGHLDLDALTILYHGGLNGRCNFTSKKCKREKVIVGKGTYIPLCSMNSSFVTDIIPAFYQLYMNQMGIDRFDDIWSGLFLKKVVDHVGDNISLGNPIVYHDKRPRNVFKDLRKEVEGMVINEMLWKVVDGLELEGKTYIDACNSLVNELNKELGEWSHPLHKKFLRKQIEKMKMWMEVIEEIN